MKLRDEEVEREIRVALVLYGGVSLAVYENGVTRTFYELVRGQGIFEALLGLLRARATVDTIAGTSAGGINGLILAACLESGTEFKSTEELWRRLGDFGALMRPMPGDAGVDSVLNGEGYYHEELVRAFNQLCVLQPGWQSPGEMDVFITGTDVRGHERRYADSLGAEIADKNHRIVFRMKHRPGRAWLGLTGRQQSDEKDAELQAAILASVSRITSSFPIAFPAFRVEQLKEHGEEVGAALDYLSHIDGMEERTFVDGGVLDNKPFGPVLEAIFYRMPTMPVDRRLFYVEPDPEPFLKKDDGAEAVVSSRAPDGSPLGIAAACLSVIPAHEGIGSDLDRLIEHNQQVRWLRQLQRTLAGGATQPPSLIEMAKYTATRVEGLCRLLVLDTDAAPSARDYPQDLRRQKMLEAANRLILRAIQQAVAVDPIAVLDKLDIAFQQRIAFRTLYALCDFLETDDHPQQLHTALRRCGRVVKALEVVFVAMIELRDRILAQTHDDEPDEALILRIIDAFCRLLCVDAPHWRGLAAALAAPFPADESRFLDTALLSDALEGAREWLRNLDLTTLTAPDWTTPTILDAIHACLRAVGSACRRNGEALNVEAFVGLDRAIYPIEFASGIHELDEIKFVRVSPADAQKGLSKREAREKVAGDELAHFSSFLRRDWRSNDLLYGRLDGICQVIRSLLDAKALLRAIRQDQLATAAARAETRLFAADNLRSLVPKAKPGSLSRIADSWKDLVAETRALIVDDHASPDEQATAATQNAEWQEAAERFRTALITAAQEDALESDFGGVLTDHYYQEIAYGRYRAPSGADAGSSDTTILGDAIKLAAQDPTRERDTRREFESMRLGGQPITGNNGGVPNDVLGEYVTAVYLLLWGVARRSLGESGGIFDISRVNLLFRAPVVVLHYIFERMRRDRTELLAVIFLSIGVAAGLAWAAFNDSDWRQLGVVLAAVLFACAIANVFLSRMRWPPIVALIVLALLGGAQLLGDSAMDCLNTEPGEARTPEAEPCAAYGQGSGPPMLQIELARSSSEIEARLGPQKSQKREAAKQLVAVDYGFIAAYGLLFLAFAYGLFSAGGWPTKSFASLAALAIVVTVGFDVVENIAMWKSLAGDAPEQRGPSLIKWAAFFFSLIPLAGATFLRCSRGMIALGLVMLASAVLGSVGLWQDWVAAIHLAFNLAALGVGLPILAWLLFAPGRAAPS